MFNLSVLIGRLVADPELRSTSTGVPVTSFRIAVDRAYQKDVTDFLDIVAWRERAEFVCQHFHKGKLILVVGSVQSRNYVDKDNNKRTAVEVVADNIRFVGPKEKKADSEEDAPAPPEKKLPAGIDPFKATSAYSDYAEMDDNGDLPF